MERFFELLEKRKNLETDVFEEEELIHLSKNLSKEELNNIDPELLTYSHTEAMKDMLSFLDKLDALINSKGL